MASSLPGTASLSLLLDRTIFMELRDGRRIVGALRSFDQFANIVLEGAVERVYVGRQYGEIPLGLYLIRGENVVLLGEVDESRDRHHNMGNKVPVEEVLEAQKQEKAKKEHLAKLRRKAAKEKGMCMEATNDDLGLGFDG